MKSCAQNTLLRRAPEGELPGVRKAEREMGVQALRESVRGNCRGSRMWSERGEGEEGLTLLLLGSQSQQEIRASWVQERKRLRC